jgi:hypothetical protein
MIDQLDTGLQRTRHFVPGSVSAILFDRSPERSDGFGSLNYLAAGYFLSLLASTDCA